MSDIRPGALAGNLVLFGRALRRAGLAVEPGQTRLFGAVLTLIGVGLRRDVKAAGRTIFVRRREEIPIYDMVFDLFWRRSAAAGGVSTALPRLRQHQGSAADQEFGRELPEVPDRSEPTAAVLPRSASRTDRIGTADFAELTGAEAREAAAMVAALRPRLPMRPSRRTRLAARGTRPALRVMLRRSLGQGGELLTWRWRRARRRPRPVVLVCDISGSMERYTRFLLRFAHALTRSGAPVEVFVFSTRLTRITRELRLRDPDAALSRVSARVVDWSGGTRIGECLHLFNRRWVRRTVRSGAVVLLVSDGWERGDPAVLAREMATLQRSCHRLIWLDPLAGQPGFEPVTSGLRAALPHVDDFRPCGTVRSLQELALSLADRPMVRRD